MATDILFSDVVKFPKADLHIHLDGAIPLRAMIRLAKKYGINLPTFDETEFRKKYTIHGVPTPQVFEKLSWAIAVMRTPQGLEEATFEVILDLANKNVSYAELRYAPGYHSIYPPPFYDPKLYELEPFPVMSLSETVKSVLRGMRRGHNETGVITNLTLCIPRESIEQYGIES